MMTTMTLYVYSPAGFVDGTMQVFAVSDDGLQRGQYLAVSTSYARAWAGALAASLPPMTLVDLLDDPNPVAHPGLAAALALLVERESE